MIIIGGHATHPIYTRVIISRSNIYAEIALHRRAVAASDITPGSTFILPEYGPLWIDALIHQGETYLVRAYDPLTYYAKYTICAKKLSSNKGTYDITGKSLRILYTVINEQKDIDLADIDAELRQPDSQGDVDVKLTLRYDNLYDAYSQIPDAIDPTCRLAIDAWYGANNYTAYQPQRGSTTPMMLSSARVVDYAYRGTVPNYAIIAGQGEGSNRVIHTVDERPQPNPPQKRQIYVNSPMSPEEYLDYIGRNEISKTDQDNLNITAKMLKNSVPTGLKPADAVYFADDPDRTYCVQSIEYTSSAAGDVAYITCGGRVMTIADRINAIIAADYAARY